MSIEQEVKEILLEIRDNQRESLRRQQEHLDIARQQLERAKRQIDESIRLQKEAMARARAVGRVVLPVLILCVGLIVYLIVRYL